MISSQTKTTQGNFKLSPALLQDKTLPAWNMFPLKSLETGVNHSAAVLMGHYLVVIVQDYSYGEGQRGSDYDSESHEPATLLAVDLRDNTIQTAHLNESMFYYIREYTFTKYKDNRIIKFGGESNSQALNTMIQITVKSFKPFSVNCERVKASGDDKQPRLRGHTAQIYNDCLYVYGGRNEDYYGGPESDLWSFDLNDLTWKLCKPAGEAPIRLDGPSSFIFQENLYIYGGKNDRKNGSSGNDIFLLSLNSMIWKRLKQQETFIMDRLIFSGAGLNGDVYKDHLIILGHSKSNNELLCCWNINTNCWSTFEIKETGISRRTSNLIVYKNLLLASGDGYDGLYMSILNLDEIKLVTLESSEQRHLKSLFMNEKGSDVAFKVQEKILPAHKEVLIQKSEYFQNLFKSGMIESRQNVIEITDCDFLTFQEFLRFIYCDEIQLDADLAIKLLSFSDKYLQNDLNEKCLNFLTHNINSDNVYTILDFARQENIPHVKSWCMKFFTNNINIHNISGLVEYLSKLNNPEFGQDNLELRNKALNFITNNYQEISNDKNSNRNITFYEDFLIKNITTDTIVLLANFISDDIREKVMPASFTPKEREILNEKAKCKFEQETKTLRHAVFGFAQQNMKSFRVKKITKDFSKAFLVDLVIYGVEEIS